jgi:hypothetical protein
MDNEDTRQRRYKKIGENDNRKNLLCRISSCSAAYCHRNFLTTPITPTSYQSSSTTINHRPQKCYTQLVAFGISLCQVSSHKLAYHKLVPARILKAVPEPQVERCTSSALRGMTFTENIAVHKFHEFFHNRQPQPR